MLAAAWTLTALAQRAELNAVTSAEDAFGTTTGNQSIGLYSLNDARGFNPQQAGNLRLEGLYFSQTSQYLNDCLVRDTSMRVGIAAQSVSFPAPTGVADLHLFIPDSATRISVVANKESFGETGALLEGQTALSGQANGVACVNYMRNFFNDQARDSQNVNLASVVSWHPGEHTEVVPFYALQTGNEHRVVPAVYTDGALPPPVFRPQRLAAGDYSQQKWSLTTSGILLRSALDPNWSLNTGVFLSHESESLGYFEEYLSVLPDGSADHVIDITPAVRSQVTSGELRLSRHTVDAAHRRTLELSLRGRSARRAYGGDALLDYGAVTLDSPAVATLRPFQTTATSKDRTRQLDAALSYEESWQGSGSFALGLLRSAYRRTLQDPNTGERSDTTDPWLASVRATANPATHVTLYASYLQGLEDAQLAPTTATNRGEPPPATRTHQSDAGVRYAPDANLSLIVGGFEIDKAYFNLDANSLYTQLGRIRHRGLEASATWSDAGYTLVAGGVWLRPHVDRALPEPGATGTVPIGPVPLTLTLNVDAAPASWQPFAARLQVDRRSGNAATADDHGRLAPVTLVGAGVRYEAKWAGHPLSVRLDAQNLTNAAGIRLTTVGQVVPDQKRRYALMFALDY